MGALVLDDPASLADARAGKLSRGTESVKRGSLWNPKSCQYLACLPGWIEDHSFLTDANHTNYCPGADLRDHGVR
jgi:hypothetical protein